MLHLPIDVILEIFFCCLPSAGETAIPSSSSAPLNISRVCRRWRTITLSTSSLWARLDIAVPEYAFNVAPVDEGQHQRLTREWFARSGDASLSVTFRVGTKNPTVEEQHRAAAHYRARSPDQADFRIDSFLYWFKFLEAQHERWKEIRFKYNKAPADREMALSIRAMPRLEELYLRIPELYYRPRVTAKAFIDFSQSRLLKSLTLSGNFVISPNHGFVLENLTSLRLLYGFVPRMVTGVVECITLIECAPALEHLDVEFLQQASQPPLTPRPLVTARNLRYFRLIDKDGDGMATTYLCSSLALPALQSLLLSCYAARRVEITSLLQRSHSPDMMLFYDTDHTEIVQTLKRLPELQSLAMTHSNLDDRDGRTLVQRLTLHTDVAEILCPRLTSILFDACMFDEDSTFLARMIHSRWTNHLAKYASEPPPRLKFAFFDCKLHGAEDAPLVKACIDQGLILELADSNESKSRLEIDSNVSGQTLTSNTSRLPPFPRAFIARDFCLMHRSLAGRMYENNSCAWVSLGS